MRGQLDNPEFANLIIDKAAKVYKANPISKSRKIENVFARMAICQQLRLKDEKIESIAFVLNKHHASVHHCLKEHESRVRFDKEYQSLYAQFLNEIGETNTSKRLTLLTAKRKIIDAIHLLRSISHDTQPFDNFLKEHYDTTI